MLLLCTAITGCIYGPCTTILLSAWFRSLPALHGGRGACSIPSLCCRWNLSEWNLRGSWMDAVVSCLVRSQSQVGLHTPWRPGREMTPLCQCTSTSWTGSMVLLRAAWLSQRVAGVECASPRGSTSECNQDGKCVLFMHAYMHRICITTVLAQFY